jgi:hypothetical protein
MRYSYFVGALRLEGLSTEEQENKLNEVGSDGWELITIREERINGRQYLLFYLKRPFSDSENASRFDPKTYGFAA